MQLCVKARQVSVEFFWFVEKGGECVSFPGLH